MAKKTIEQLKERKRLCLLRARRNLAEAIAIDERIEKMRTGKIKAPEPKGIKHSLAPARATWHFNDELEL